MVCRAVVLAALLVVSAAFPMPDESSFRPSQGSRGGHSQSSASFTPSQQSSRSSEGGNAGQRNTRDSIGGGFGGGGGFSGAHEGGFGGGVGGGGGGGGGGFQGGHLGEPDKTIYVRLPENNKFPHGPPKSAGPPQKHYRIVIIRSPNPPPVQPVLPPRTEQKTIIYVLHQKPKIAQQQVLEAPVVKHPPQVLFVGYDDELSSSDLQQLAKGDHTGFSVTAQQEPVLDGTVDGGFQNNQVFGGGHGGGGLGGGFSNSQLGADFGSGSLNQFQSGGSGFGAGGNGFSYNKRRSAPAPPGRV